MTPYLLVALGSAFGGALRYGVNTASGRWLGMEFPYGTLFVNVAGSFVMGLLAAYFARKGAALEGWRLFLATGVLGGFTTFSAFSLDTALLYERGQAGVAAGYAGGSVVLSLAALFAGLAITRSLAG